MMPRLPIHKWFGIFRDFLYRCDWALTRKLTGLLFGAEHQKNLGIGAIVKEEGPYLLEWIAWHRCLGVSKFFIADNMSADGTSELLKALHDEGIVTRIEWAVQPAPGLQVAAYKHIVETYGRSVDWLAFIDVDEFFRPSIPAYSPNPARLAAIGGFRGRGGLCPGF